MIEWNTGIADAPAPPVSSASTSSSLSTLSDESSDDREKRRPRRDKVKDDSERVESSSSAVYVA